MKKILLLIFIVPGLNSISQTCDSLAVKQIYAEADKLLDIDVNRSCQMAAKALELSKKCPQSKYYYESVNSLSRALFQQDRHDSIIRFLLKVYEAMPANVPLRYKARICHGLSSSMTPILRLEEGLKYGLLALKYYEEGRERPQAANMLINIANIYQQQYNFRQADKMLRGAEKIAASIKDSAVAGNVYNSMGILYAEHNRLDSAEKFFLKSTIIREALGDKTSIVWNYSNLGGIYTLLKKPEKAMYYFEKANQKFLQDSNYYGLSSVSQNLGEAYMLLNKPDKALECFKYARKYAGIVGDLDNIENIYTNLSSYYYHLGNSDMAYLYADSLMKLKDTIYGKRLDERIAEMQTKFDVEKKDLEIAKNKTELELKEKRNQQKNTIIVSIALLVSLGGTASYLVYRKKRIEQKAKYDMEIAKQKELRTKAIIEAEEKERRRIAQDLHDGIGQILSAAKLNLSNYQSRITPQSQEEKDALKNAADLIDDSVKEVRAVSHNMMPNTLIKSGLASAIREFITKIGSIPNLKVDLEIVGLDKRLNEQTETVLYRVIQEIINNIIKHSKANTIGIQLIRHEEEVTVMIEDNGIGFDTSKIEEFGGIGLKNIISRVEFLNGRVDFDSTPGHGTNVIIEIPLT